MRPGAAVKSLLLYLISSATLCVTGLGQSSTQIPATQTPVTQTPATQIPGTQNPAQNPATQDSATQIPMMPEPPNYVLGPKDAISIWAREPAEINSNNVRIDGNGFVNLPLVQSVQAAGFT